jgi:hypothetical protein
MSRLVSHWDALQRSRVMSRGTTAYPTAYLARARDRSRPCTYVQARRAARVQRDRGVRVDRTLRSR